MSYQVVKHTKRYLLERCTQIHLEEYGQDVNVVELFDDRNVCQRIIITDWGEEDITASLSEKMRDSLIKVARMHHGDVR